MYSSCSYFSSHLFRKSSILIVPSNMSSRLLTVTAQAAALSAVSNTLAQGFTVYRERALSSIDPVAFAHFILLAVITTPPNYQWQLALERNFPSTRKKDGAAAKKKDDDAAFQDRNDQNNGKETLSVTNTLAKFLLDQTVGATLNTVFFIAMINLLRGAGWSQVVTAVQRVRYPSAFFPANPVTDLCL